MAKEDAEKKDEVAPGFPPPGAVEPGEDGPDYPPGPHPSFLKPDYEFRNTLEPEQRAKFDELHALLFEKLRGGGHTTNWNRNMAFFSHPLSFVPHSNIVSYACSL
jgi:hypothetical protein